MGRGWHFRPRLLPTLAVLLLVPLFFSLGQWQWNKAAAKDERQSQLDQRSAQMPIQLPGTPLDAESLRFRSVAVRGIWEPQYQILIDNRVHQERAGYHVITPLRIEGSEMRVLVNRGWIPAEAVHTQIPSVNTPAGLIDLSGIALVPGNRFFSLAAEAESPQWQTVWQNLDFPRYIGKLPFPLQPVVIQMSADSEGGGFVRDWPRPDERIEQHLGYALQWWGFAASTVLIWLFVNFRRK